MSYYSVTRPISYIIIIESSYKCPIFILRILCYHHSIYVEIEDLYKTETGSAAVKWTIELQLERVITPSPSPALLSRPRPAQVPGILDIGMRPDDSLILIISYS